MRSPRAPRGAENALRALGDPQERLPAALVARGHTSGLGALVGLLESLMTAKLVDEITDTGSNKTRESLGQGAANILSGFFGGLVGNQGGIRSAALLGFDLTPKQLVATATASAVLVDLARVPVYLLNRGGMIAAEIPLILTASVGVVIGNTPERCGDYSMRARRVAPTAAAARRRYCSWRARFR